MILSFNNVTKKYSELETAIRDVSFQVQEGEFTALAGSSGSGKSTILNLAAGLDFPTSGVVRLLEKDLSALSKAEMSDLRCNQVGFVFQSYNLFPVLTALENVEYPLALKKVPPKERKQLAQQALEETGCGELGKRLPSELSGGQQQRIAIARAIVTTPKIVFADEPTANLDSKTARKLLEVFKDLNSSRGITFLFSSHDPLVLETAERIIQVADGKVQETQTPHLQNRSISIRSFKRYPSKFLGSRAGGISKILPNLSETQAEWDLPTQ